MGVEGWSLSGYSHNGGRRMELVRVQWGYKDGACQGTVTVGVGGWSLSGTVRVGGQTVSGYSEGRRTDLVRIQ